VPVVRPPRALACALGGAPAAHAERFGPARGGVRRGLGIVLLAPLLADRRAGHRWLQAHMGQHLLADGVAPPLLWLGAPVRRCLQGCRFARGARVASMLASRPVRRLTGALTNPRVAWVFVRPSRSGVACPSL